MINQRVFFNILDEDNNPIKKAFITILGHREKYLGETDNCGIVEFLIPLGNYVLSIEGEGYFKRNYKMFLRESFSFTRIYLKRIKNKNIKDYYKEKKEEKDIENKLNRDKKVLKEDCYTQSFDAIIDEAKKVFEDILNFTISLEDLKEYPHENLLNIENLKNESHKILNDLEDENKENTYDILDYEELEDI